MKKTTYRLIKAVNMAVNLYEQQKKAVSQLKPGSILVGGVGTGKSITSLAFFYEKICGGKIPRTGSGDIREMANPTDLYIITTAKKRDSLEWDEELSKFCLSRNEGPLKLLLIVGTTSRSTSMFPMHSLYSTSSVLSEQALGPSRFGR